MILILIIYKENIIIKGSIFLKTKLFLSKKVLINWYKVLIQTYNVASDSM